MIGVFAGDFAGSDYRGIQHSSGLAIPLTPDSAQLTLPSLVAMGAADAYWQRDLDASECVSQWSDLAPARCLPTLHGADHLWQPCSSLAGVIAVTFATLCRREEEARLHTEATCRTLFGESLASDSASLAGILQRLKMARNPELALAALIDELEWPLPLDLDAVACDKGESRDFAAAVPLGVYIGLVSESLETAIRIAIWAGSDPASTAAIAAQTTALRLGTESLPGDLRRGCLEAFDSFGEMGQDMRRRLMAAELLDIEG